MTPDLTDEELRRLYLDWCSTQVARRFLELSLDDVWLRSDLAASIPPRSAEQGPNPSPLSFSAEQIPGYLDLVRRTALLLADEMDLPRFDEWKRSYLQNPETFREDILSN